VLYGGDICRLVLQVKTIQASQVSLEVWFPENWSGRFLSTGNGGLMGCIFYHDMAYAAAMGFAVVGTNNGHSAGDTGRPFLNHPEVLNLHDLRTRTSGVDDFAQFHMPFPADTSLAVAHATMQVVEAQLAKALPGTYLLYCSRRKRVLSGGM